MPPGAPKTEDEIYEEARSQLAKIMMTQEHTIYNLERQSKEVSEYPLSDLARKAGFPNTREFLQSWFDDLIEIDGTTIRAYSTLYDTAELQHIISLQERTKLKNRKGGGGGRRGRGGGSRGGRAVMPNRTIPLRPPPMAARRAPEPPHVQPRRQESPSRGYPGRRPESPSRGGYPGRRPESPLRGYPAEREPPFNRVTSPYNDERRRSPYYERHASPSQSVVSFSSARTEPMDNHHLPPLMGRLRSPPLAEPLRPRHDYVDHNRAPPPGFDDDRSYDRPYREVRATDYESHSPAAASNKYDYFVDDDDEGDPFGVGTARTFNTQDEFVDVRSRHPEDLGREHLPPPRGAFYDDEYEPEYFEPERTPPRYDEDRRAQPRRVEHDYHNRGAVQNDDEYVRRGNDYRDEPGYHSPPPPSVGYDLYVHQRVTGVLRERNTNRTPEPEIFHDAEEVLNYRPVSPNDSFEFELPSCRTFTDKQMPYQEISLKSNNYTQLSARISPFPAESDNDFIYSKDWVEYFAEVITDLHDIIIRSPTFPIFYAIIKFPPLPRKIFLEPGYDGYSIYCVMKALGYDFFRFHEDLEVEPGVAVLRIEDRKREILSDLAFKKLIKPALKYLMPKLDIPQYTGDQRVKAFVLESKDEKFPYFVKLNKTLKEEKELENELRNATTLDVVNPHPRALCIYTKDGKPYRAQIIAELYHKNISIELVDVGVYLTVRLSELKRVESNLLSSKPRYAIPVELVNIGAKNIPLEQSVDGFPRRSTNARTVSMILTPQEDYMSMRLD